MYAASTAAVAARHAAHHQDDSIVRAADAVVKAMKVATHNTSRDEEGLPAALAAAAAVITSSNNSCCNGPSPSPRKETLAAESALPMQSPAIANTASLANCMVQEGETVEPFTVEKFINGTAARCLRNLTLCVPS